MTEDEMFGWHCSLDGFNLLNFSISGDQDALHPPGIGRKTSHGSLLFSGEQRRVRVFFCTGCFSSNFYSKQYATLAYLEQLILEPHQFPPLGASHVRS